MNLDSELVATVETAVRESLQGSRVAGFALLTDDDVVSISAAFTDDSRDECRFESPNDWPHQVFEPAFEPAYEALQRHHARLEFSEHKSAAFASFVEALRRVKADGLFLGAYLAVISTDPSPAMERRADDAAIQLNSAEVLQARERHLKSIG